MFEGKIDGSRLNYMIEGKIDRDRLSCMIDGKLDENMPGYMGKGTRPQNILMVTPRYFPHMGGIETHVHEVGRMLTSRGVNVTLLTTMPPSLSTPLPREEIIENMRVIRVQAWPSTRDYYIAPEIYSLVKNGNWDLVHCQGCHTFVPLFAMQAAKEAKIPYVVTFHTGGHSSRFRKSIRKIQWRLLRPYLAQAAQLIGVSHFEAEYFRDLLHLPEKLFSVIPNGAALPALLPASIPTQRNHTVIASVGRLEHYKGHHRLIKALPDIRKIYPDAQLLILGAGPYEQALRTLVQKVGVTEHVEIRSVKVSDRQAMAETLAQTTLVTLLSEYEAHPIAVMEALALKRPVLVSDTSGLKELANQGFARAISLSSSSAEIALAVQLQIEEPIAPVAGFALPTWEQCVDQLRMIYNAALKED
jgi:glycosyltransferase involved in cell wall biosynthesis